MAAEYEVNIKINTQEIERELKKVDKAVKNIGKEKGGKKQPILALPSTEMLNATARKIQSLDSVNRKIALKQREINKQTRDQALNIKTLVNTQDRRARLLNKINEMEAKGLNLSKLRKQLAKATTEQSARRFGSAEKEFRVLEKTLRLEQSKLRILREQRKGFPSSPIRGTRTMMGSPAQIAASGRQRVSPIAGRIDIAGSPAQMQAIRQLEMAEIRADKNAHFAELRLIQKRQKIQLDNVDKLFRANERELEKFNRKLEAADKARQKRLAGAPIPGLGGRTFGPSRAFAGPFVSPIGGTEGTPGSPAFNRALELGRFRSSPIGGATNIAGSPAARRVRRQRLEQVGLGAGFPLLFGGGAGSVIGGGLGGLTGSFGAQIAFSAIGQQIDQFIAGVSNIGKSLTSASGTLEMFREKNLFSSDAVKEHAFELEQQGKMQELATLLTKDLASQVGKNAVESFQVLGGEVKEFLKTINHLFVAVGGFVAGPLAKLLEVINKVLGGVSTEVRFASLRDSLTGEARAQFDAIVEQERGTRKLTSQERQRNISKGKSTAPVIGKLTTAVKERVLANEAIPGLRQAINVTGRTTLDDTLGFKPPKTLGPTKEEREKARLQKRLGQLAAERQAIIDVSRFKDKIAAANAAEDQQLVIRLQGEQKMAEIEGKRLKDLAGVTEQREKDAINIGAATEKLAAQRNVERELGELQRKRQEKFETTIESLDHQLALARATTEEERERLRIEEALRKLREDDKLSQPQLNDIRTRMEALAEEKNLINTFLKETREQIEKLNDPMFQAISLATTLGNAFSESFRGIVDGSMSAQQALANLFQRTADHFLDMAAQMIAAQIRMKILGIALNFFSSAAGAGAGAEAASKSGSAFAGTLNPAGSLGSGPGFAPPSTFAPPQLGNFSVPPTLSAASGAYVSSPTRALIGEGGEPEFVIPESKMRESMARYSRGARGPAVIPEVGGSGTSGEGGGVAVAAPIDVRYTVERINSVNYVTADQFQAGMQQAAQQGAREGERRALGSMQNSPAVRRRVRI